MSSKVRGFTFGVRCPENFARHAETPGPLDYTTSTISRFGKYTSPAYSIKNPHLDIAEKLNQTPGPSDYQPLQSFNKLKPNKSYSFTRSDRVVFSTKDTPPPNSYQVPTTMGDKVPDKKKTGAAYTIQGRAKGLPGQHTEGPGPGAYHTGDIHLVKKRGPRASLIGHKKSPFVPKETDLPGPGTYDTLRTQIDKIKGRKAPRAPFGVKHTPKKFTVFTLEDLAAQ